MPAGDHDGHAAVTPLRGTPSPVAPALSEMSLNQRIVSSGAFSPLLPASAQLPPFNVSLFQENQSFGYGVSVLILAPCKFIDVL